MLKRVLVAAAIAGVCALGVPASAQTDEAKQDGKAAAQAAKDAGKAVGEAGKEVGKDAGEAGKDAGKTAKAGATTVKHRATGTRVTATCNDGTTYTGKTRKGACSAHGGVKTWGKA